MFSYLFGLNILFLFLHYKMAHAAGTSCDRMSKSNKLVVAAIDFGTTYSGYAFSFSNEYKDDPAKVYAQTKWVAGSGALMSLKTPTVILLNPDRSFNSFGYEAENEYIRLAEEEEHKKYYYFRRFKMMLYNSKVCVGFTFSLKLGERVYSDIPRPFLTKMQAP